MPPDAFETATKHRTELSSRYPALRLMDLVEPTARRQEWLDDFRRTSAVLADALLSEEVTADSRALATAQTIAELSAPTAAAAWSSLSATVTNARPSRKGMVLALRHFGAWLQSAGTNHTPAYLRLLPEIAPVLSELGRSGVDEVLRRLVSVPRQRAEDFAGYVGRYGATSAQTVAAIARLARRAIDWDRSDHLDRMARVLPPEAVPRDKDASRFFPALAAFGETAAEVGGKALWDQSLTLVLILGPKSHSSAYCVAEQLSRKIGTLEANVALRYLHEFACLAEGVGVRATGFGLDTLPGLFLKYDADSVSRFVGAACAAAHSSGPTVAAWFLERKTRAAKDTLVPHV